MGYPSASERLHTIAMERVREEERRAWDMYVAAMLTNSTIGDAARWSDDMLVERRKRFGVTK